MNNTVRKSQLSLFFLLLKILNKGMGHFMFNESNLSREATVDCDEIHFSRLKDILLIIWWFKFNWRTTNKSLVVVTYSRIDFTAIKN